MRNRIVIITAVLIASLCAHVVGDADQQPDVKFQTLLHSSSAWDGASYDGYPKGTPELSVLRITIGCAGPVPHNLGQGLDVR
jgi:hypothetical protein